MGAPFRFYKQNEDGVDVYYQVAIAEMPGEEDWVLVMTKLDAQHLVKSMTGEWVEDDPWPIVDRYLNVRINL